MAGGGRTGTPGRLRTVPDGGALGVGGRRWENRDCGEFADSGDCGRPKRLRTVRDGGWPQMADGGRWKTVAESRQREAADGGEVTERRRAVGKRRGDGGRWRDDGRWRDGGRRRDGRGWGDGGRRRGDGGRPAIADGGSWQTVVDSGQREATDGGEATERRRAVGRRQRDSGRWRDSGGWGDGGQREDGGETVGRSRYIQYHSPSMVSASTQVTISNITTPRQLIPTPLFRNTSPLTHTPSHPFTSPVPTSSSFPLTN